MSETALSPGRFGLWAGAIAFAILATVSAGSASAQDEHTLVVAAQATPNGLDWEYNYAPADHQIRRAVYSKLRSLKFEKNSVVMWLPVLQPKTVLVGQLAEGPHLGDPRRGAANCSLQRISDTLVGRLLDVGPDKGDT